MLSRTWVSDFFISGDTGRIESGQSFRFSGSSSSLTVEGELELWRGGFPQAEGRWALREGEWEEEEKMSILLLCLGYSFFQKENLNLVYLMIQMLQITSSDGSTASSNKGNIVGNTLQSGLSHIQH